MVDDEQSSGVAVPTPRRDEPPGPPSVAAGSHRGRALLILAVVVAFVVVTSGLVGLVLYDRATAIDRSTPDVVVDQFLHATTVERNVDRIQLFVCSTWPSVDALKIASVGLDPEVISSWSSIKVLERSEDEVTANVAVRLSIDGFSDIEDWRMTVVREKTEWRVCSLARDRSIPPTTAPPSPQQ